MDTLTRCFTGAQPPGGLARGTKEPPATVPLIGGPVELASATVPLIGGPVELADPVAPHVLVTAFGSLFSGFQCTCEYNAFAFLWDRSRPG